MNDKKPSRLKGLITKRWWSALLWALAVVVIFRLVSAPSMMLHYVGKIFDILSPFFGGLIIAFLLYRPCDGIEQLLGKSKKPFWQKTARIWALVAVYLMFLGVLTVIVSVILPALVDAVRGLIENLPTYYANVLAFVEEHSAEGDVLASVDVQAIVNAGYEFLLSHLTVESVIGYLSDIISITGSLINVLLSLIISVYMLAGRDALLASGRRLGEAFLPERAVRIASRYTHKASDIFTRYIYSMMVDALCVCVLLIPGMYIAMHNVEHVAPLAFAIFVGLANIIPYFGAIISGVITVLVLLLNGEIGMAIFLAIYILVVQQVDSNLLQPRIFGQSVGIRPIYVLLAVTVGGGIAGFGGVLLGVPVVAVLKMLVTDWIAHRERLRREEEERDDTEANEGEETT